MVDNEEVVSPGIAAYECQSSYTTTGLESGSTTFTSASMATGCVASLFFSDWFHVEFTMTRTAPLLHQTNCPAFHLRLLLATLDIPKGDPHCVVCTDIF